MLSFKKKRTTLEDPDLHSVTHLRLKRQQKRKQRKRRNQKNKPIRLKSQSWTAIPTALTTAAPTTTKTTVTTRAKTKENLQLCTERTKETKIAATIDQTSILA